MQNVQLQRLGDAVTDQLSARRAAEKTMKARRPRWVNPADFAGDRLVRRRRGASSRSRPSSPTLRILVVSDTPPISSGRGADGNTLITAQVLPRLVDAGGVELTVAWFDADGVQPDDAVLEAATRTLVLPLRGGRSLSISKLTEPIAAYERTSPASRRAVAELSAGHDVTLLHGIGVMTLARDVRSPVVVSEVDPWSLHWSDLQAGASLRQRAALLARIVRLKRVERIAAERSDAYLVVNAADARELEQQIGRPVTAIPNGVRPGPAGPGEPVAGRMVFVGTLDYPSNVESAVALAKDVLPAARAADPRAHVVLAGRRAVPEILALAGPDVTVLADVPDVMDVFAGATLAVFSGGFGRGTRNSVLEALRAGCPVVATPKSARGIPRSEGLLEVPDAQLGQAVAGLLMDPVRLAAMRDAAWRTGQALPDWDQVAATYRELLTRVASQAG
jgi:glycosyltransferase involved in cell wall biosynthesis